MLDVSFVKKLKVQTAQDVLRTLVSQFESAGSDSAQYPYVSVSVGNVLYSGIPVKVETIRSDAWLTLLCPERGLRGMDALVYLPLNLVTTVSVDNFRVQVGAITAGMPPNVPDADVPSRLTLERSMAEVKAKVGLEIQFIGMDQNTEPAARYVLAQLLKGLEPVLLHLQADALGKESLQSLARIALQFSESESLAVEKSGNDLQIIIGFGQNLKKLDGVLMGLVEKAL